ncbi:unnamed protein product [Sphagnum troendelagicum]|uniref:START domain-containing protein n=1 Tax=Sphagnum troendelagicum TaxID=128251 RepID=A0ABP0U2A1_9BRYO
MEGYLYYVHSHKLRLNHPRKRYVVLVGNRASSYKDKPASKDATPVRSGPIELYTRVIDHGREVIHSRVYFTFSLHHPEKYEDHLKFGSRSAEEAAKWMQAFRQAAEEEGAPGNDRPFVPAPGKRWHPFRYCKCNRVVHPADSRDWTGSLLAKDASPDVVATSPWQIFGCKNGLRLFKETTDDKGNLKDKRGEDPPALMSVGVVHATSEAIFETVMSLGASRAEWDFCFWKGRVIEHVDGHTDVVHKQLHTHWLPWRMNPRDLLLHRYWRREDDGSYVILYHSVTHEKCPTRSGFRRAWLKSGGYVISPLQRQGGFHERSLVKHMLMVDWKDWKAFWVPSRNRDMTLCMLERVAAIRELYKVKEKPVIDQESTELNDESLGAVVQAESRDVSKVSSLQQQEGKGPQPLIEESQSTFLQGADDEFFDAEESSQEHEVDSELQYSSESEGTFDETDQKKQKILAAATLRKRLHDLASAQRETQRQRSHRGTDLDAVTFLNQEGSLPMSTSSSSYNSWSTADASTFLIRGKQYLKNQKKVKAGNPIMQFVAADWFKSDKREDHVASRSGCVLQKLEAQQKSDAEVGDLFFFVINLQVPGTPTHSLVLYYMVSQPLSRFPLLESFVHEDDRYRNSRFKLIPHIAKGSWIVKQSVGKTACLVGEALEITYFSGHNYLELDVDIGSSSVAKGVVNLVIGYLSKLVIEMAFLIQANTEEELPENILGTCRLSNLDMTKAISAPAT